METALPLIRFAVRSETPLILAMIRELAEYEGLSDHVVATEAVLESSLFDERSAEVLLLFVGEKPAGFALFFHNFSTFLGRKGLYLEDLFVRPLFRGQGWGKLLMAELARLAKDRNCGRLEWWCLDENRPSVEFYQRLGSEPMTDWTVFRLADTALDALADQTL